MSEDVGRREAWRREVQGRQGRERESEMSEAVAVAAAVVVVVVGKEAW